MISFVDFIEQKPLYYKEIDHQRIHDAYALISHHINRPRTIHIVGTNGKGSTGRIAAHLAYASGLRVGHFSSPHILKFNERIWIDGEESSGDILESSHQKLFTLLGEEVSRALSYFEYTTLLAFVAFESLDFVVLEAGLGGEYDATNVCDKELSIITPIGIDHQAFLGERIEDIARTKIRSIQKELLLAPQIYAEVLPIAQEIAQERGAILHQASLQNKEALTAIAQAKNWGEYLIDNALVALQALDILGITYDIEHLMQVELFARFYPLTPHIRIDVGHNPLAASAILQVLDERVVLIYNSLDDKEYLQVLEILKPKLKRVEIIPIPSQRAATTEQIERALQTLGIEYSHFTGSIADDEEYLVFGSFYVVEEFLKHNWKAPN